MAGLFSNYNVWERLWRKLTLSSNVGIQATTGFLCSLLERNIYTFSMCWHGEGFEQVHVSFSVKDQGLYYWHVRILISIQVSTAYSYIMYKTKLVMDNARKPSTVLNAVEMLSSLPTIHSDAYAIFSRSLRHGIIHIMNQLSE